MVADIQAYRNEQNLKAIGKRILNLENLLILTFPDLFEKCSDGIQPKEKK